MLTQETFVDQVNRYISLDAHIKDHSKTLNELRKKKRQIGESLLEFMQEKDIAVCDISSNRGASLVRNVKTSVRGLKRDYIEDVLLQEMQDPARAGMLADLLWDKREVVDREILKYEEPGKKKRKPVPASQS